MTDHTTSNEPTDASDDPVRADLDELLSAELDGELDAAARDLGLSADAARARLRATPGIEARRAALTRARDLLAESPAFDELLDARLRAKAVRAAEDVSTADTAKRRERRRRALQGAGGIAAALLAVLAVAAGLRHGGSASNSSAGADRALARPAENALGSGVGAASVGVTHRADLGVFSDDKSTALAALRTSAELQSRNATAPVGSGASTVAGSTTTVLDRTASSTPAPTHTQSSTAAKPADSASGDSATAAPSQSFAAARAATRTASCGVPPGVPVYGTLRLRGSAVVSGRPVVVLVFTEPGRNTVVIEDETCALVNLQVFS